MPVFRRVHLALLVASLAGPAALAADPQGSTEPAAALAPAPPASPGEAASAAVPVPHPQSPSRHLACLTKSEQRAAVSSKSAMSLGNAIKSLRAHGRRAEVVRARLCRRDERLVYVLTLLGRSGRVREVGVDAVSGDLIVGR